MSVERRRRWWAPTLGLFLASAAAEAQEPVTVAAPAPAPVPVRRVGPIRRAIKAAHDDFIGVPDAFYEPPVGASMYETFGMMRAKAAPHVFTLYSTDFLVDSPALTPSGTGRMDRIARGVRGWCGPVIIQPTPGRPALAESRREAVLALLGPAVGPERVVIGPPVAPGALGTDAANFYQNMIIRDQQAASTYTLTPSASTAPGGGGGPR
jgi:hypothetical protein